MLDEDYALVIVQPVPAVMPRARWLEVLDDYTVLGHDRSGLFVISDVWRRRHGVWRVWRRHSTPLSAGEMPGA